MLKDEETLKKSGKKTPMKTKKIRKLKPKTEEKINLSFETTELGKMFRKIKEKACENERENPLQVEVRSQEKDRKLNGENYAVRKLIPEKNG